MIHTFKEDFYGEILSVVMVGYIRPERSYDSLGKILISVRLHGVIIVIHCVSWGIPACFQPVVTTWCLFANISSIFIHSMLVQASKIVLGNYFRDSMVTLQKDSSHFSGCPCILTHTERLPDGRCLSNACSGWELVQISSASRERQVSVEACRTAVSSKEIKGLCPFYLSAFGV